MPTPELIDKTPTVWHHFRELWQLLVALFFIGVAWGRMEWRMSTLSKQHRALKADLDDKTDKQVCNAVHISSRENVDLLMHAMELGHKTIREDFKELSRRLDSHIIQNGKKV